MSPLPTVMSSLYLRLRRIILVGLVCFELYLRFGNHSTPFPLSPIILVGALVIGELIRKIRLRRNATLVVFGIDLAALVPITYVDGLISITGFGLIATLLGFLETIANPTYLALYAIGSGVLIALLSIYSTVTPLDTPIIALLVGVFWLCSMLIASLKIRVGTHYGLAVGSDSKKRDGAPRGEIVHLYHASVATSKETEPGGIMDILAEDARRLVGAESASVALFLEKDLLASVTKGISPEFKRNLKWRVRKGGMTEWVLTTGKPLLINDAERDPRSRDSSAVRIGKQRSIMAVPLKVKDEVLGVLYVGDTRKRSFTEHDLMLLTILSNHAASSIRQARLGEELKRKLKELERAHKELISTDRLKSEFISAVTTQMRRPLDAIRTYSQTVLDRMHDTSFKLKEKFLGAVVEESSKLLSTVDSVIDLSRLEFGEGDLRKEIVNVRDLLKSVCSDAEPICVERNVDITVVTDGESPTVYADRELLTLLFRNLVEIAVSNAQRGSSITVSLDDDGSFLRVTFSFEPSASTLEIADTLNAISGGEIIPPEAGTIGLALQVSKNIVLRHGGRIWAETHDPSSWRIVLLFGKQTRKITSCDIICEIIRSRPELKRMLELVTDMISKVMEVKTCLLFIEDQTTGELVLEASTSEDSSKRNVRVVGKGEGLVGKVFERGIPIVLNSWQDIADLQHGEVLPYEKLPCAYVPIRVRERVIGVLGVCGPTAKESLDTTDLGLLVALGDRIGIALEHATSYESARDQFVSAMIAMKSVLQARRTASKTSERATRLVVELGRAMGLGEEDVRLLQYVSRIYDVGMVRVGDGILRKRGGLGAGEYECIKRHPVEGVDIVGPIEFLEQVKEIILHHHERYDGKGYPSGLSGEEIPIGARILAVVDAYESMVSERPYRRALSSEEAIEELRRCSGKQFDPVAVEKFIQILNRLEGEKERVKDES